MSRSSSPHLWLALSPHGFGHAAMTAPVVAALKRRRPGLRLTIQTGVRPDFLESRYGAGFDLVRDIPDFGFRMNSSVDIDLDASAEAYRHLHRNWPEVVEREAERLRAAAPDLVLANAPYVTIAAAALAGIPVAGFSSLEWADIYDHYLGDRPGSAAIVAQMAEAYNAGDVFLKAVPGMDMPRLTKVVEIGTVGEAGTRCPDLAQRLGLGPGSRIGVIVFGGIDHRLDLARWPRLDGWVWLTPMDVPPDRSDLRPLTAAGLDFPDLLASADVLVTKPGYGAFSEAGLLGCPVLYLPRPDWPECPHLDLWLQAHTRALPITVEMLLGPGLETQLRSLFSLPVPVLARADGNEAAAAILESLLERERG